MIEAIPYQDFGENGVLLIQIHEFLDDGEYSVSGF